MSDLLQVCVNGVVAGAVIALVAVGYSLVYGVLRFVNFAFGEVLTGAAYLFYVGRVLLGLDVWLVGGVSVLLVAVLGALIQYGAYRPLYRRSRLGCLVTALGVSLVLQNAILLLAGAGPRTLRGHVANDRFTLAGVVVTHAQVTILVTALLLLGVSEVVVYHSSLGLRVRAVADDLPMAEILGVKVDRTILGVFALGSAMAAGAGVLLSLEHLLKPTMGTAPAMQAFAACVVGRIGSLRGAVGMAFFVALVTHLCIYRWPQLTPETVASALLLAVLAGLPEGLSMPGMQRRGA